MGTGWSAGCYDELWAAAAAEMDWVVVSNVATACVPRNSFQQSGSFAWSLKTDNSVRSILYTERRGGRRAPSALQRTCTEVLVEFKTIARRP